MGKFPHIIWPSRGEKCRLTTWMRFANNRSDISLKTLIQHPENIVGLTTDR